MATDSIPLDAAQRLAADFKRSGSQHDEEVDEALFSLLRAALDQPRPSRELSRAVNTVLPLVGHPLVVRKSA